MEFKLLFVLLFVFISGHYASKPFKRLNGEQKLLEVVLNSINSRDYVGTEEMQRCLEYSQQDFIAITNKFEADYAECSNAADKALAKLDAESQETRNGLIGQGNEACSNLKECESIQQGNKFFECYNSAALQSSRSLNTVSAEARIAGLNYDKQKIDIDSTCNICVDACEVEYERNIDRTSDLLKDCLQGNGWPSSTPQPSTPEPSTPEPSTPEPSTPEPSTPEPSTPEPPTPEPSTPEPSTPEPSTPEPSTPEPSTPEPSTPEPSTPEPSTPEPSTPERSPEEDLDFIRRHSIKNLRRVMSRIKF